MKLSLFYPLKPWRVNQPFGNVLPMYTALGLKGHNGMDLYAVDSQPVRAAHDGVVVFTGEDGSGGLGVVLRTLNKFDYLDGYKQSWYKTIYWHLKPGTFKVKAGDKVATGDILALADNTGMSTGTHLHWGLKPVYKGEKDWEWWNAEQTNGYKGAINPQSYLTGIHAEDVVRYKGLLVSLVGLLEKLLALIKK
jgi:murein DD-endopeptidase MepM/ murein hydrolase activator NlpD